MSARVEAASRAFQHALPYLTYDAAARDALAAADAVMFDDAAIERAAKAMFAEEQCDGLQKLDVEQNWNNRLLERDRDEYRGMTRAVVAALKGDDQ